MAPKAQAPPLRDSNFHTHKKFGQGKIALAGKRRDEIQLENKVACRVGGWEKIGWISSVFLQRPLISPHYYR